MARMKGKLIDEFGLEYQVPDNQVSVIGKSRECDIVLPPVPNHPGHRDRFHLHLILPGEPNRQRTDAAFEAYRSLSRKHAIIDTTGKVPTIRDNDSTNGTYIFGMPITERAIPIDEQTPIKLGDIKLRYHQYL